MTPSTSKQSLRTRFAAAGLAAAAAVALSACGAGDASSPTILNTEKVERAIEHSSVAQRGTDPRVSCPSGVHQEKGLTFDCVAILGRTSTRFVVTQSDSTGNVHYQAAR